MYICIEKGKGGGGGGVGLIITTLFTNNICVYCLILNARRVFSLLTMLPHFVLQSCCTNLKLYYVC